jgi:hypothetical protein
VLRGIEPSEKPVNPALPDDPPQKARERHFSRSNGHAASYAQATPRS